MSKLEIRVGETYLTRDGRKAFVCTHYQYSYDYPETAFVKYSVEGSHDLYCCDRGGKNQWYNNPKDEPSENLDLIAKWEDPRLEVAVKALENIVDKVESVDRNPTDDHYDLSDIADKALKQIKGSE